MLHAIGPLPLRRTATASRAIYERLHDLKLVVLKLLVLKLLSRPDGPGCLDGGCVCDSVRDDLGLVFGGVSARTGSGDTPALEIVAEIAVSIPVETAVEISVWIAVENRGRFHDGPMYAASPAAQTD
jgi:hypothetical protein